MNLEKIEIMTASYSTDSDSEQAKSAQLSDLELSLIGGGMGDVQQ